MKQKREWIQKMEIWNSHLEMVICVLFVSDCAYELVIGWICIIYWEIKKQPTTLQKATIFQIHFCLLCRDFVVVTQKINRDEWEGEEEKRVREPNLNTPCISFRPVKVIWACKKKKWNSTRRLSLTCTSTNAHTHSQTVNAAHIHTNERLFSQFD